MCATSLKRDLRPALLLQDLIHGKNCLVLCFEESDVASISLMIRSDSAPGIYSYAIDQPSALFVRTCLRNQWMAAVFLTKVDALQDPGGSAGASYDTDEDNLACF